MEAVTDGLALLMAGHGDRVSMEQKRHRIQAPEVLSKIHWLGNEVMELSSRVKAKEVCQVLYLERSKLLSLLSSSTINEFAFTSSLEKTFRHQKDLKILNQFKTALSRAS